MSEGVCLAKGVPMGVETLKLSKSALMSRNREETLSLVL